MHSIFLTPLYRRWQRSSLRAKLLLPVVGLMLISLLGSTLAFVVGTALTQNQLLGRQTSAEADRITQALTSRVKSVANVADLLARDPQIFRAVRVEGETALSELNSRAVVVRDRFDLDLIQIYDQDGQARTNLVLSSLYRESSLLDQVVGNEPVVRVVAERALLLCRADIPQGAGTVIVGIDLETELQSQDIAMIHDAGQHLLALINDVLDISKINAGKLELDIKPVDLVDLVESVLGTTAALLKGKSVTLERDIDPALPPVCADERRIRQVLLNLLSNAARFTESGQILLRTSVVEALNPRTEEIEPFAEVSVSDTGIGIPQEKLVDIFKEFTQVDDSETRRAGGAGLGLPISKKLVELHGGRIWVKSKLEQGSTFTFILPLYLSDHMAPLKQVGVREACYEN